MADRQTILVLDGSQHDEPAIEWAHLELGEDPSLLRVQIEREQRRQTARMLMRQGSTTAT